MDEPNTIRCPHCGLSISREAARGQTLSGSPLRRCPGCGRLYFDEAYQECALALYGEKRLHFNYIKLVYFALPTAGALIYLQTWRSGANPNALVPAIAFGALSLLFLGVLIHELVRFFQKRKARAAAHALLEGRAGPRSQELEESLERLRDRAYLDALKACGEYIPEFFLQRAEGDPADNDQGGTES